MVTYSTQYTHRANAATAQILGGRKIKKCNQRHHSPSSPTENTARTPHQKGAIAGTKQHDDTRMIYPRISPAPVLLDRKRRYIISIFPPRHPSCINNFLVLSLSFSRAKSPRPRRLQADSQPWSKVSHAACPLCHQIFGDVLQTLLVKTTIIACVVTCGIVNNDPTKRVTRSGGGVRRGARFGCRHLDEQEAGLILPRLPSFYRHFTKHFIYATIELRGRKSRLSLERLFH